MEIPNYDSAGKAADKKYKQLYRFMPSDTLERDQSVTILRKVKTICFPFLHF